MQNEKPRAMAGISDKAWILITIACFAVWLAFGYAVFT